MTTPAVAEAGTEEVKPPKREPRLRTITNIENVVNEYARKKAKEWKTGLKDDEFVILLSGRFKGIMGMQRGHPVKITLAWPDAQANLNTLLSDAFRLIREKKMVDVWALERVVHIRSRNVESRKWRREKFGELGEIIGELIPRKNISVETTTISQITTVIRDLGTGVEITKTEAVTTTKKSDGRDISVKTWLELSRMARDEEDSDDDNGGEGIVVESPQPEQTAS